MIWIFPVLIFLIAYLISKIVISSYLGEPPYWSEHTQLKIQHQYLMIYKEANGVAPEEGLVNDLISKLWVAEGKLDSKNNDLYGAELEIFIICFDFKAIKYLGEPPIYIVSENLPDGYGLYWRGKDGVTHSEGNDPDDINTWDKESRLFYYDRLKNKEFKRDVLFALVLQYWLLYVWSDLEKEISRF